MFQITKFTLSDRIYPHECTYIRIEVILWPRQILRAVKVRAIWWGKRPCSFNFLSEIGNLTLFPDKSQNSAWINGEKGDLSCMFFNSHLNSNNINAILGLNYMNFFYINEILSHHEYTECRAAECPVPTNRNTDRKTQTTRIKRWPWHC